jgi:hypothetical protein
VVNTEQVRVKEEDEGTVVLEAGGGPRGILALRLSSTVPHICRRVHPFAERWTGCWPTKAKLRRAEHLQQN